MTLLALVYWLTENKTGIVPESQITDRKMLTDKNREGSVRYEKVGRAEWKCYQARVLAVGAKVSDLDQADAEFWDSRDAKVEEKKQKKCQKGSTIQGSQKESTIRMTGSKRKRGEEASEKSTQRQILEEVIARNAELDDESRSPLATSPLRKSIKQDDEALNDDGCFNTDDVVAHGHVEEMKWSGNTTRLLGNNNNNEAINIIRSMNILHSMENKVETNERSAGQPMFCLPSVFSASSFQSRSQPLLSSSPIAVKVERKEAREILRLERGAFKAERDALKIERDSCIAERDLLLQELSFYKSGLQSITKYFSDGVEGLVKMSNQATSSLPGPKISLGLAPVTGHAITENAMSTSGEAMIDLGFGILVPRIKLELIRADGGTKLARNLVDIMFTQEELSSCTVTGKCGKNGVVKPALDETKVLVLKSTEWGKIRQCIADKIKESKANLKAKSSSTHENSSMDLWDDNSVEFTQ